MNSSDNSKAFKATYSLGLLNSLTIQLHRRE